MRRRRSWIVIVIVVLVLVALVARRTAPPARAAPADPPAVTAVAATANGVAHVSVSDDRATLRGEHDDGTTAFTYTLEDWRAWAEDHLEDRLGEAVTIGEQEMPPSTFDMIGTAAPSPAGERVAFTVHTYAMLTTVSVVTVLDPSTMQIDVVSEAAFGGVDELVWSPGGRFVAYALGTARAAGDGLRIDDVVELRPVRLLTAEDVLAVAPALRAVNASEWLPMFRDLTWIGDERLLFTTNDPAVPGTEEPGARRWSLTLDARATTGD